MFVALAIGIAITPDGSGPDRISIAIPIAIDSCPQITTKELDSHFSRYSC
jgi:hypothetical protein